MKRATISELKSRLSEHLRAAEAGETIEVMDRARPIARVVPLDGEAGVAEWLPAERSFASVRRIRLPSLRLPMSSLQALLIDRGTR
jgi:prevent-host-death family protein